MTFVNRDLPIIDMLDDSSRRVQWETQDFPGSINSKGGANLLMGMKIKKIGLMEGTSLRYLKSANGVEKAEILSSSFHVSGQAMCIITIP